MTCPTLPAFVEVVYPNEQGTSTVQTVTLSSLTCVPSGLGGVPNTCKIFHDTADGVSSVLQSLTQQIACDFYNFVNNQYDYVWAQIILWQPEGISDCVIFTFDANTLDTRVFTPPLNDYPEEMLHYVGPTVQTVVTDVQCQEGNLNVYATDLTYQGASVAEVGSQYFLKQAGCCDCSSESGGCDCPVTICPVACTSSTPLVGAVVTVGSLSPITTGPSGCAIFQLCPEQSGSYQVTISDSGYVTYSNTLTLSCGRNYAIELTPTAKPSILFTVTGCCSQPLPGATVTIAGNTYTTDSSGQVSIGVTDVGTYPWSISKARFTTLTGSTMIVMVCPSTIDVNETLSPASGYQCAPSDNTGTVLLADPIPVNLDLTDSQYGSFGITYSSSLPAGWGPGSALSPCTLPSGPGWYSAAGGESVTFPASCNCPSSGVTVWYYLQYSCQTGTNNPCGTVCQMWFYPVYEASGCVSVLAFPCNSTVHNGQGPDLAGPDLSDSLSPTIPYDYQMVYTASLTCDTFATCAQCFDAPTGTCFYPSGLTLTITE